MEIKCYIPWLTSAIRRQGRRHSPGLTINIGGVHSRAGLFLLTPIEIFYDTVVEGIPCIVYLLMCYWRNDQNKNTCIMATFMLFLRLNIFNESYATVRSKMTYTISHCGWICLPNPPLWMTLYTCWWFQTFAYTFPSSDTQVQIYYLFGCIVYNW